MTPTIEYPEADWGKNRWKWHALEAILEALTLPQDKFEHFLTERHNMSIRQLISLNATVNFVRALNDFTVRELNLPRKE